MKKEVFALAAFLVLAFTLMSGCADDDSGDLGSRPIAEISIDNLATSNATLHEVLFSNGTYYASRDVDVLFNASHSLDVDGKIRMFIWDFGDGGVGYGSTLSHMYLAEKTYTVTLTIKDDKGNTDSDFVTIRVSGGPGYGVSMKIATKSHLASPGRDTDFSITLSNTGNVEDTFTLTAGSLPSGFTFTPEFASVKILPGQDKLVIATISVPATASKIKQSIPITVTSRADPGTYRTEMVDVDVKTAGAGPAIEGALVQCQYIGWYEDGEVFDSSLEEFKEGRGDEPLLVSLGTESSGGYTSVIVGFKDGLIGMRVGETNVVRLTSEEGYNDGKVRIFEIKLVSIDG